MAGSETEGAGVDSSRPDDEPSDLCAAPSSSDGTGAGREVACRGLGEEGSGPASVAAAPSVRADRPGVTGSDSPSGALSEGGAGLTRREVVNTAPEGADANEIGIVGHYANQDGRMCLRF